jgi:hypothetical protein
MKKYRVTDKHPGLKEGCTIHENTNRLLVNDTDIDTVSVWTLSHTSNKGVIFINHLIEVPLIEWLESGWIEEIQELEFTKDDIAEAFLAGAESGSLIDDIRTGVAFRHWIKKYKKQKNKL